VPRPMRRAWKRLAFVAGLVVLLAIAVRLLLDPIATWYTRRTLAGLKGMRSTFSDVSVSLKDLSYAIHDLRIEKVAAEGSALPLFQVKRAELGVHGRELLRGQLVANVQLDAPKLALVSEGKQKKEEHGEAIEQGPKDVPKLGRKLEQLAPFRLDRLQVKEGELIWVDAREPERPSLWLHGIEGTLENFATRAALAKHEPTVMAARGTLQRSGEISVFMTADPLAKSLTFAGQGRLRGLELWELGSVLSAKSDVAPDQGKIDMSVRFRAEDGRITGGVRPVLTDVEVNQTKPGLIPKLKELLADVGLKIFSDEDDGKEKVATTIPIVGRVDAPQVQAVPTVIGILRNAFVQGLSDSLHGLPPPKAKEKQGVVEQARRGLSRKREPEAQPTGNGE
jgi:hypothetical protein